MKTQPFLPLARVTLGNGTVADAMHPGVLSCSVRTPLSRVARMMVLYRIHAVVVYSEEDADPGDTTRFWGVVADLDIAAAAAAGEDFETVTAGQAARTPVVHVTPNDSLVRAAELMTMHKAAHLLVVTPEFEAPVGVISALDLAGVVAS